MRTNHLVDPTFFFDAIEEFSFNYPIYVVNKAGDVDEYGNTKLKYERKTIRGSLQVQTKREIQSKDGNTAEVRYMFYCKSQLIKSFLNFTLDFTKIPRPVFIIR